MTTDVIEREIYIDADIQHVWSLVSRAGFWVGDELHFDVDAGEGELAVIHTDSYGQFPVRVARLDPPRYAAYRWASGFVGAEPTDGNSTLVEFTLVEQGSGVNVRVRESGFASLDGTDDFRTAQFDGNTRGWAAQLDRLRAIAARAGAGATVS